MNPKAQRQPTWKLHAYFLDACNCDWGCPCQFNAKPTHGNCEGVTGYHIVTGSYGVSVKLDGLNMALIASWPGPIHEGHGKASFYIDNRTDEKQFEALSNIITGRAGGGPFVVYASTIEEIQEPKRASVKFQTEDTRSRVSVFWTREDKKRKTKDVLTILYYSFDAVISFNTDSPAFCISSLLRSCLCVAIDQMCPKGSCSCPYLSPQNMSMTGITVVAPAFTA